MILSIETSTNICSLALHENASLLCQTEIRLDKSHSKYITIAIDQLLHFANTTYQDLKAIAISEGPGSYTGLRIGMATAKGLCYGLDIPLIAVSTLEAMALSASYSNYSQMLLCPMIDARRMEVYASIYNSDLNCIQKTEPIILTQDSFSNYLSEQKIIFLGNGAPKWKDFLLDKTNAFFNLEILPNADSIGKIAFNKYTAEKFEDIAYFEPFYLKEFQRFK